MVEKALVDIRTTSDLIRTGAQSKEETVAFERREFLPYLFNNLGLVGKGIEIGVQQGAFSELLLSNWNGECLYSIDPWKEFPAEDYDDIANLSQERHDAFYIETLIRLRPYGGRSIVWRLTSEQAANLIDEQSLDFCYIDADHSYEGCSKDIQLWFPKIKRGGILAGHDYIPDGQYRHGTFGVRRAVRELFEGKKLPIFITQEPDTDCWSWFVCKR